jgi:hypothetical protein
MVEELRVQTFIRTEAIHPAAHTCGARIMLLTDRPDGDSAQRLISYGSLVEIEDQPGAALTAVLEDPLGFDLFVMDCDAFGGIDAAERAIATLIANDAKMRVMLVSREFDTPAYPLGRRTAVCLPDPVSDERFHQGFVHVLRDRKPVTLM